MVLVIELILLSSCLLAGGVGVGSGVFHIKRNLRRVGTFLRPGARVGVPRPLAIDQAGEGGNPPPVDGDPDGYMSDDGSSCTIVGSVRNMRRRGNRGGGGHPIRYRHVVSCSLWDLALRRLYEPEFVATRQAFKDLRDELVVRHRRDGCIVYYDDGTEGEVQPDTCWYLVMPWLSEAISINDEYVKDILRQHDRNRVVNYAPLWKRHIMARDNVTNVTLWGRLGISVGAFLARRGRSSALPPLE